MPKYIDAERFKLWLQENYAPCDRYFIDIDAQPTADVVVRKTGKWIKDDVGVHCSECWYGWNYITGVPEEVYEFKYCPNCGARLYEGEETISDYDPCDECHENGDDYYQDEDGEWMMRCYDCPLCERREDE